MTAKKKSKKGGQILPAITEGNTVQESKKKKKVITRIAKGEREVNKKPLTFSTLMRALECSDIPTRKQLIKDIEKSGRIEEIICASKDETTRNYNRVMWMLLIATGKIDRSGTRKRKSPQEKKFENLLPQLDLKKNPKLIQDKLFELGLEIEKTTLYRLLKKYRSR